MRSFSNTRILFFLIVFLLAAPVNDAYSFTMAMQRNLTQKMVKKKAPKRSKEVKIKGSRTAEKAKKKQAAKEKKDAKAYAKYVKDNQKRSIEIQTPEVQERMKKNLKDSDSKYKSKKKKNASGTKKAGKKYK